LFLSHYLLPPFYVNNFQNVAPTLENATAMPVTRMGHS
jgi:hypothetical protein